MESQVRVRIAPSPTGPIHVGNARTALFNYLYARKTGGQFVLRLEDTDLERSEARWEQVVYDELHWLGLDWDEGPEKGGVYAPYRQSERLDLYADFAQRLLAHGHAYRCFCTPGQIEADRRRAQGLGEAYRYHGRCRDLTEAECQERIDQGHPYAIRFRVDPAQTVVVDDVVYGAVSFLGKDIGDFIIVRSNGIPVYNFAVVVDDLSMHITHVLRASEHLSNSAAQMLLYQALGAKPPTVAHVGLVLGPDRHKLSKRNGDAFIGEFREQGYLPEALFNFLALLGWAPAGEREIFTRDELIEEFSLNRLANHPAILDRDKLNWMNAQYIRRLLPEELYERALPFLRGADLVGATVDVEDQDRLVDILHLVQDELVTLSDIPERVALFLQDELPEINGEAQEVLSGEHVPHVLEAFSQKVEEAPQIDRETVQRLFKELRRETGLGGRKVFMPIRAALTGKIHGPELYSLIPLLGRERLRSRLRTACSHYLP